MSLAKTNARRIAGALTVLLLMLAAPIQIHGQSSQTGKIDSWDIEAYGKQGNVAVYYIQIGDTIYQVTRGMKKPEAGLESGQQVECRIEKDDMFVSSGQIKELKFSIITSAQ